MNYSKYASKAKSKINQYGGECYIVRASEETYNEETNTYESVEETLNGKCIISSYDMNKIDGENIKIGDVNIMAVFDSKPKVSDVIHVGDNVYNIISISELNPDGKCSIYFDIQGR